MQLYFFLPLLAVLAAFSGAGLGILQGFEVKQNVYRWAGGPPEQQIKREYPVGSFLVQLYAWTSL